MLQEEAVLDIQVAFEWYEEKREGLGDELLQEIEHCLKEIKEHPHHYSFVNNLYRRIKTRRFPYLIVYEIEGDRVVINSVVHAKRKAK